LGTSSKPGPTLHHSKSGSLNEDDSHDEGAEPNDVKHEASQPAIPILINDQKSNHFQPTGSGKRIDNLKNIKKSNKLLQALNLPTIMNVNPRSIYNKVTEFHTFVEEHSIDCVFMSESWERPDEPLEQIIKLPNHTVISNPHQRKGVGGRPALIINNTKYHIRNITQSLIEIPWGVEATWAIMTPKNVTNESSIQKIAVCSVYSKPSSKKKTLLLDHINQAFHTISTKFGKGLHFIIAGDTNDLKLGNILNLSHNMRQLVQGVTRLDPPCHAGSHYIHPGLLLPGPCLPPTTRCRPRLKWQPQRPFNCGHEAN
jgi:hypothetical protein